MPLDSSATDRIPLILWRIAWNGAGFAAAIPLAAAVTVTLLFFLDGGPGDWSSIPLLARHWFQLFVAGCFYTATMAVVPTAMFLVAMELTGRQGRLIYAIAGALVALISHLLLWSLGVNLLAQTSIVLSSLIGGACGGLILWKIAQFGTAGSIRIRS